MIRFRVAGVSFEGRDKLIEKMSEDELVTFIPEPDNPFDENAIKIINNKNEHIGYVPAKRTKFIHPLIDKLEPDEVLTGKVVAIYRIPDMNVGITIEVDDS